MKFLDRIRNNPWWIAGGVAVLVVLWMLSGLGGSDAPAEATQAEQTGTTDVRVRHQQAEPVARFVSVYGRTEPARTVTLKAETGGRVDQVLVERGAYVKRGSELVRIDVRDRDAQLERARAEVRAAKLRYEAEQKLQNESFASETRLAEAQAQYEAAQAELRRIEVDLANTRITAPFDGAVQERLVEIGDYVAPGDPVATFVEVDTLIVTGSVAETERANLEIGSRASAKLITGQEAVGKLRYIAPVADESTRTFRIELEVPNPDRALPAGVTAEIELPAGETLAHRISPAILALDENGEIGIKTINGDNTVEFTKVDIVKSSGEGIWISGLPEQADIIVVGQGFVRPGEKVTPVFENGAAASPAVNAAVEAAGGAE